MEGFLQRCILEQLLYMIDVCQKSYVRGEFVKIK